MMVIRGRVGVSIRGITELQTDFTRMTRLSKEGRQEYLGVLAKIFLNALIKFAPAETGNYINAWRVITQQQDRIVIGPARESPLRRNDAGGTTQGISPRQLAVILEFTGAQPHTIRPKSDDGVLVFDWGGQRVFFTLVRHPGMKPKPHIRRALAETKRQAKGIAYAIAAQYMPTTRKRWSDSMIKAARLSGYDGPIPPRQIGRNKKDISANITRGAKGNFSSRLSVGLSGKRLRSRGLTRAVGSSESGLKAGRNAASRIQGQGLERFR